MNYELGSLYVDLSDLHFYFMLDGSYVSGFLDFAPEETEHTYKSKAPTLSEDHYILIGVGPASVTFLHSFWGDFYEQYFR